MKREGRVSSPYSAGDFIVSVRRSHATYLRPRVGRGHYRLIVHWLRWVFAVHHPTAPARTVTPDE